MIVYKDGKKLAEGHSFSANEILRFANVEFESRALDGTEFDYQVCETGITPDLLSEVPS